ncbi:hypothetical protein PAMP_007582 [Pampus punctatissimus]
MEQQQKGETLTNLAAIEDLSPSIRLYLLHSSNHSDSNSRMIHKLPLQMLVLQSPFFSHLSSFNPPFDQPCRDWIPKQSPSA